MDYGLWLVHPCLTVRNIPPFHVGRVLGAEVEKQDEGSWIIELKLETSFWLGGGGARH